jgi:hypothetical protein
MTRLVAAEFRKLFTTRLWLWLLLGATAWTAGFCALAIALNDRPGSLAPALSTAAGRHALYAIGAGGAGPLAAVLAAAGVAGEFRHRTVAATFLATPRRGRVVAAKLITYLLAGASYALVCIAVGLAIALPWLSAKGISASPDLPAQAAIVLSTAIFAVSGAGLAAMLGSELITVAGLLFYLYVAEPVLSHVTALHAWTAYLPGVAADGLTQAAQAGVRLLSPWAGGLVFAVWAAGFAAAGTLVTTRRDITG